MAAAGLAATGTYHVLDTYQEQIAQTEASKPDEIRVFMAARRMVAGHVITADDLEERSTRAEFLPYNAVVDPVDLIGRTTILTVLRGEPIRSERLAPAGAKPGLSAIIERGLRALSLNISGGGQVSGFIEPGNRVDVLITLTPAGAELREAETTTLMQSVQVLAVDDRLAESEVRGVNLKPQVTIAVRPEFAEKVTHALRAGNVKLTLRGDADNTVYGERGTLTSDFIGTSEPGARLTVAQWQGRTAEPPTTVTLIHGSEVVTEVIED